MEGFFCKPRYYLSQLRDAVVQHFQFNEKFDHHSAFPLYECSNRYVNDQMYPVQYKMLSEIQMLRLRARKISYPYFSKILQLEHGV